MLANIVWENRAVFSDADPNDNRFDNVFGGITTLQAIGVVDAAIDYWEKVITDFNYPMGEDYSITISMNASPGSLGANGGFSQVNGGKPSVGSIGIGWQSGITPTTDNAAGWYLDPTPSEHSEFQGAFLNAFVRTPSPGMGGVDLFTVVLHELGHAIGLGATQKTRAWSFNSAAVDTINTPASVPASTYWPFDGPSGSSLWTSWDSGGASGTANNAGGPQHFAPLGAQWPAVNPTHFGAAALMNARVTSRSIISDAEALAAADAYGYSIVRPSSFGTMYNTLDANGNLRIDFTSLVGSGDYLQLSTSGDTLITYFDTGVPVPGIDPVGGVTSSFPLSAISSIDIRTGGGQDFIRIEGNGGKPITVDAGGGDDVIDFSFFGKNLGNIAASTFVNGGAGIDSIFAYDNNSSAAATYSVNSARFDRPGWGGFSYAADIEALSLTTGTGADTVNVTSTFPGQPVVLNSAGGEEIVNIGSAASGVQSIRADVQIQNDPWFTTLNISDVGNSTPRNVIVDQWVGNFGAMAGLAPAYITWDNADIRDIHITTGSGADVLDILRMSERLYITNTNGVDEVTLGNDVTGISEITNVVDVGPNAPFVVSNLTIDDSAGTLGRSVSWVPGGNGFFLTGLPAGLRYENIRDLNFLAGSGWDQFSLPGIPDDAIHIHGGGGVDSLLIDDRNMPFAMASSTIREDRLERQSGGGFPIGVTTYFSDVESPTFYLDDSSTSNTIYGTPGSIPNGYQLTVFSGSNNDTFTVKPRDADGNPSILGAMGILGGLGTDTIVIDDADSATGTSWTIDNFFGAGTQNFVVAGGAHFGSSSDVENVTLAGSAGDDVFYLDRYASGTALQVLGNDGNDVLEASATSLNLASTFTSISAFLFDGGEGYDQFLLHNDGSQGGWDYTRTSDFFRAIGPFYFLTLHNANVEYLFATTGAQNDNFFIQAVPADTATGFDGGDGYNQYFIGNGGLTGGILGGVQLFATVGTNTITVDNSSDTVGRTVHVDVDTVGAMPGDDLFGTGGYLLYSNFVELTVKLGIGDDTVYAVPHPYTSIVIDDPNPAARESTDFLGLAFAAVTDPVFTETGPNAGIYTFADAAPLSYTGFESSAIDDSAPTVLATTFLQDTAWHRLLFEFSEDLSANLRASDLILTDLSTGETIDAADIGLSYDMSTNTAVFTFPGLPNGTLAPGDYSASLRERVSDLYGNRLLPYTPLLFSVASATPDGDFNDDGLYDLLDIDALVAEIAAGTHQAVFDLTGDSLVDLADRDAWLAEAGGVNLGLGLRYLLGDANLDGVVDTSDFNLWNAHKFTAVAAWSQGDFNADGVVDTSDFNIWNNAKFTSALRPAVTQRHVSWVTLADAARPAESPGRAQLNPGYHRLVTP